MGFIIRQNNIKAQTQEICFIPVLVSEYPDTNYIAYGTRKFNATSTKGLQ